MLKKVPTVIIDFINKYDTFFIIGHEEPDGDCLGSQKVASSFLRRIGKKTVLISPGPFIRPEIKEIEPLFSKTIREAALKSGIDSAAGAALILDCSTPERIGKTLAGEIESLPCGVIDHHASGLPFGDAVFVNGDAPSTTILVYQLMKEMKIEPSNEEAEDLLFGFLTDTGYFRHLDSTNAGSMKLAAELMSYGVSLKNLYYRMYGGRELESRLLTGLILSRAQPLFGGKCIMIYETFAEKKRFGPENRDSDTIYSQLLTAKGCEAVVFIREEGETECSVSLRSLNDVDVGKIASTFGGGGHKRAAGFAWKGTRRDIENRLKEIFGKVFV